MEKHWCNLNVHCQSNYLENNEHFGIMLHTSTTGGWCDEVLLNRRLSHERGARTRNLRSKVRL